MISRGSDRSQLAATCCVGYKTRPPWLKQSNREGLNVAAKSKTSVTSIKSSAKTAAPVKKKSVHRRPSPLPRGQARLQPKRPRVRSRARLLHLYARRMQPNPDGEEQVGSGQSDCQASQGPAKSGSQQVRRQTEGGDQEQAALPKVAAKTAGGKLSKPVAGAVKKVAKASPTAQSKKTSSKPSTTASRAQKPVSKQAVQKPAIKSAAKGKVAVSSPVGKKSSVLGIVKSATRAIAKVVSTAKRAKPQAAVVKPTAKVATKALSMASGSRSKMPTTSAKGGKKVPDAVTKANKKSVEPAVAVPAKPASKPTATVSKASPSTAKAPTPTEGLSNDTGNSMKSSGTRSAPSGKSSTTSTGGRAVGVRAPSRLPCRLP